MLRGFRWQLVALVVAIGVFGVSLLTRSSDPVEPAPSAAPTNTSAPTSTPTPEPVAAVDEVPIDNQGVQESNQVRPSFDGIPTYREALVGRVQRLNPLLAGLNPVDADITALIFEGLVRVNAYGELVPALADNWVVSFDGLEYVVTLRDDILWHDGTPFTSADVEYTMSLLSDPGFPGPAQIGAFWRTVETQVIDDYRVRFRLAQPLATFPEALRVGILPYHAFVGTQVSQLVDHSFNLSPVGTGPYQLEALRASDGQIRAVDLRVAPVYRQRPEGEDGYAIERITFRLYDSFDDALNALRSGEVDGYAARERSDRRVLVDASGRSAAHTAIGPAVGMIIFNWVDEDFWLFREQRVRQALVRGLDRGSVIDRHLYNLAVRAESPMLPLSWAYEYDGQTIAWPGYDLALARSLLETVNVPEELSGERRLRVPPPVEVTEEAAIDEAETDGEDGDTSDEEEAVEEFIDESGVLFAFTILTPDDPALVNVAGEIATQWAQLNLTVEVEAVDLQTYRDRLESGDFDVALVELSQEGSADPDVYSFWHEGQYPEGQNYGGVNDRAISEALENARSDHNALHRSEHYRQFQQEFINRAIAIPLYYPLYTYAVSTAIQDVQLGFVSGPPDRFISLREWSIQ
jgi:peptide/nickel transport system substrate-binding protein